MLYVEWTSSTYHTAILLPRETELTHGFRSVYLFDQEQKKVIEAQGSMANLEQMEIYSDTLFIDIDSGKYEDAVACQQKLDAMNLNYSVWDSGSKGFHIHIPLAKVYKHCQLPAIQKEWAKRIDPQLDGSIYKHSGLIRLPNTKHKKTGRRKTMLGEVTDRQPLELDLSIKPNTPKIISRDDYTTVEEALRWAVFDLINEPIQGNRYMTLWKTAKSLQSAGFSEDFVKEMLETMNNSWANPKEDDEIERCMKDVFK